MRLSILTKFSGFVLDFRSLAEGRFFIRGFLVRGKLLRDFWFKGKIVKGILVFI